MDPIETRWSLVPYVAVAVLLALFAMRALGIGRGAKAGPSVGIDGVAGGGGTRGPKRIGGSHARVWVHVAGAVKRPGLYRVEAGARAGEAVDAAGGVARRADLRAVNLASTVRDGQQIIVPARGEAPTPAATDGGAAPAGGAPGAPGASGAKLSLA